MSQWFYAEGNRERRGPLPAASIVELFRSNRIAGDTLVWREGASDWRPLADFAAMLQREIGASVEAVIALCSNLDETHVWTALAPQGRLVTLGLVQTDSTLAILRDDPYTLSGLLLALLSPPPQRPSIPVSGHGTLG